MTVITARPRWLKQSIGTFISIHTTWIVNSEKLVSCQVEKITLGTTIQPPLYTDARPRMIPQRSGGLENSNFSHSKGTEVIHPV